MPRRPHLPGSMEGEGGLLPPVRQACPPCFFQWTEARWPRLTDMLRRAYAFTVQAAETITHTQHGTNEIPTGIHAGLDSAGR